MRPFCPNGRRTRRRVWRLTQLYKSRPRPIHGRRQLGGRRPRLLVGLSRRHDGPLVGMRFPRPVSVPRCAVPNSGAGLTAGGASPKRAGQPAHRVVADHRVRHGSPDFAMLKVGSSAISRVSSTAPARRSSRPVASGCACRTDTSSWPRSRRPRRAARAAPR